MSACSSEDSRQKPAQKPFFHQSKILGLGFCWECIEEKIILTPVEVERKTFLGVIETEVKPMETEKGYCSLLDTVKGGGLQPRTARGSPVGFAKRTVRAAVPAKATGKGAQRSPPKICSSRKLCQTFGLSPRPQCLWERSLTGFRSRLSKVQTDKHVFEAKCGRQPETRESLIDGWRTSSTVGDRRRWNVLSSQPVLVCKVHALQ